MNSNRIVVRILQVFVFIKLFVSGFRFLQQGKTPKAVVPQQEQRKTIEFKHNSDIDNVHPEGFRMTIDQAKKHAAIVCVGLGVMVNGGCPPASVAADSKSNVGFFDFKGKMKNVDANKLAAKEAEAKALSTENLDKFKAFENNAILNLGKEADSNTIFIDKKNGFALNIPPSWSKLPRKTPTPSMERFQEEQVLFVSNSFAEGASLSVTRTNPVRLLKDFEIDWWFSPQSKISDLGSPELVAGLLILQRQGDFEKKNSVSQVKNAVMDKNTLEFEFSTPLAANVSRKTLVRALYSPPSEGFPAGKLDCSWVSALSGVYDSEYGPRLVALRDSFALL